MKDKLNTLNWRILKITINCRLVKTQKEVFQMKKFHRPRLNSKESFRSVFLYHWKEETTHAIMDELEWPLQDKKINNEQRDRAVDELIGLVAEIDDILKAQSADDVEYFIKICGDAISLSQIEALRAGVLKAYRRQYIFSGVQHPRYQKIVNSLITEEQGIRINSALAPLM